MKLSLIFLLPALVFADEILAPLPEDWGKVIAVITSGELSSLAIVAALVQLVMLVLKTRLGEFAGKWRLLAVSLLSVVGGVVALRMQGIEWGPSLTHASTLAAFQVFLHQLYKHVQPKPVPVQATRKSKKAK